MNFRILEKLANDNCQSLKAFGAGNITNVRSGKDGWGRVEIAVDNATAIELALGKSLIVLLLVVRQDDYDAASLALEGGGER